MRERIWVWEYAGAQGNEGQWRSSRVACPIHGYVIYEYIRADHVDALLKAEREKALREALAACEKSLSDMQRDNPDRHDALPYIEDGCGACQDAILDLLSKDDTP